MTGQTRKPAARKSRTSATRQARRPSGNRNHAVAEGPPSLTKAHMLGFVAGILSGLLLGIGAATWLFKQPNKPTVATAAAETEPADPDIPSKPRFDFFTLLPNQELNLVPDVEPASVETGPEQATHYILQAGSFRLRADADQRRGELALLGLEASIEQTKNDNGIWFRVYIGPFDSRSKMAQARSLTAQQSIDTLLLKRTQD